MAHVLNQQPGFASHSAPVAAASQPIQIKSEDLFLEEGPFPTIASFDGSPLSPAHQARVPHSPSDSAGDGSSSCEDASPLTYFDGGMSGTTGNDGVFRLDGQTIFTPSEQKYFSEFLDQLANDDGHAPLTLDQSFLSGAGMPMAPMQSPLFRMPPSDFPTTPQGSFDGDKARFDQYMQAPQPAFTTLPPQPTAIPPQMILAQDTTPRSGSAASSVAASPASRSTPRRSNARAPGTASTPSSGGVSKASRSRSTGAAAAGALSATNAHPAMIAAAAAAAAQEANALAMQTPLGLPLQPILNSKVKPSLARGARPQQDDDGDDDDELSEGRVGSTGQRELLTEEEKRMNHIISEKKRRNNIRLAFKTMTDIIPSLQGTNYSKATILNKANEYLVHLKERNAALSSEVYRLRDMLEKRGFDPATGAPLAGGASHVPLAVGAVPTAASAAAAPAPVASSGTQEVSWARGTPTFSDEAKIFAIWSCFLIAMVNPIALAERAVSSSSASDSPSSPGRTLQSLAVSYIPIWLPWLWTVARWMLVSLAIYLSLTFDNLVKPNSKAYQRARESRLEGEKAPFFKREQHFLTALEYLGCPLPTTDVGLIVSLVWQTSRQLFHLTVVGRWIEQFAVRQRGVEESVLELARNFHALAHQYISSEAVPIKAWVSLLRALNLAECTPADNNPLLAEVYSSLSFQVQFHLPNTWLLKRLARHYRARADAVRSSAECSTKTLGYVVMHDSFEKMANGRLREAAAGLRNVGRLFLDCGRYRSAWEVLVFHSLARYLRGEVRETVKAAAEIRDLYISWPVVPPAAGEPDDDAVAAAKGDEHRSALVSQRLWSNMLYCLALLETNEVAPAVAVHEEVLKLSEKCRYDETKWSESGHLQQVLLRALTAVVRCRQGRHADALASCSEAITLFDNVSQPMFFGVSFLAYALVADALILTWTETKDEHAEAVQQRLAPVARHLRQFAKAFSFARPRSLFVDGILDCITAETTKDSAAGERGRSKLNEAIEAARRFDMPLDEACATFYLQRCSEMPAYDAVSEARDTCQAVGATFRCHQIEMYLHERFGKRF